MADCLPTDPFGLVGTVLERRYRIDRVAAVGGFGVVYEGHHVGLDRPIAIKVMRPIPGANPDAWVDGVTAFLLEAKAIARIDHPAVVGVFDVGVGLRDRYPSGVPWIVFEWIAGETLQARLERRRGQGGLPPAEALRLLRPAFEAIARAHAIGILHRDLKPSNIMLTPGDAGPSVRVLDFGIAKLAPDEPATTGGETTTRSPNRAFSAVSAAPEQIAGTRTGPWTDVYALGLLLTEVLTDAPPYPAGDPNARLVAMYDERRPTPRKLGVDVGAWEPILERALAVHPAGRYASVADLLAALEAALPGARAVREPRAGAAPLQPSGRGGATDEHSTRTQLASAGPTGSVTRGKRGWVGMLGGALGVAAVAGAGVWKLAPRREARVVVARDAAPATQAESQMSANGEATAAYRAGVQALRDASWGLAGAQLGRAIELDGTFAAAHLRRAVIPHYQMPATMAEDLQIARSGRGSLGDHDRIVVDAMEPWTRVPPDLAESAKRFQAALDRDPSNADFAVLLSWTLGNAGDDVRAAAVIDAAVANEPSLGVAHYLKARGRVLHADVPGATASYEQCLEVSPGATACLGELATLESYEGRCENMAATLRRLIAVAPSDPRPYGRLAEALFSMGESVDAVNAALAQKWERMAPAARRLPQALVGAALATLTGQFEKSEQLDREIEGLMVAMPSEVVHFFPAYDRMLLSLETGRNAEVQRVASDYLAHRSAWQRDEMTQEQTILVYGAQHDAGELTDAKFGALRDDWLARDRERPLAAGLARPRWIMAYAHPARTPEEAASAIEALPRDTVLTYPLDATVAEATEPIGRAYLLAGKIDEAIPYLRRASAACAPFAPWGAEFSTWATAELGEALEARGDSAGACVAYRRVLERWGEAKPASRTATKARARARALKCPP